MNGSLTCGWMCVVVITVAGISATPYEDNLRYFQVVIAGPQSSPYESESLRHVSCIAYIMHL